LNRSIVQVKGYQILLWLVCIVFSTISSHDINNSTVGNCIKIGQRTLFYVSSKCVWQVMCILKLEQLYWTIFIIPGFTFIKNDQVCFSDHEVRLLTYLYLPVKIKPQENQALQSLELGCCSLNILTKAEATVDAILTKAAPLYQDLDKGSISWQHQNGSNSEGVSGAGRTDGRTDSPVPSARGRHHRVYIPAREDRWTLWWATEH